METKDINETKMSIYIPHVFKNISKKFIIDIFEDLKYGKVKKVDFIDKIDSKGVIYYAAYIHFDYWYDNIACQNFQERVKNPDKEARIVYNEPWYWICLENKSSYAYDGVLGCGSNNKQKRELGERRTKINLDDLYTSTIDTTSKNVCIEQSKINLNDLFAAASLKNSIKNEENKKLIKNIDIMEYVKQLEMMNYKLMYDIRNIQGDFIMI